MPETPGNIGSKQTGKGTPYSTTSRRASESFDGNASVRPESPLPALTLPTGGGAIRGIGEKFQANAVTGTGSFSVPIVTSPGRAGFDLTLSLGYDSGAGNGPFGIGWGLSVPQITRKTDKGLPRYEDATESDVFILSGAEDLVPVRIASGAGTHLDFDERIERGTPYRVQRYRPRVEGLFARIERWTDRDTGDAHWRATTPDNTTSIYGRNTQARIVDPENPRRVFSWLLEETRDDRGNIARYSYKSEDGAGVQSDKASEQNRFEFDANDGQTFKTTAQRYLKRVEYGNHKPDDTSAFFFEVVFDYGEHDLQQPVPAETTAWPVRPDPFSSHRAGFEVRTYRLCRRVLMFHRFVDELGPEPYLVRSTDFDYREGPVVTYLEKVTQVGYQRDDATGNYRRKQLPSLECGYILPEIHDKLNTLDDESLEGIPGGISGRSQWVDLDGEGIPGVLTATEGAWFYKENLGGGKLGPPLRQRILPAPAALASGAQQITDLAGDGELDLVQYSAPLAGYFERVQPRRDQSGDWQPFQPLRQQPNIDWNDPNLRFLDLDGDGHPDVLITEHDVFVWYRSRAKHGFDPAVLIRKSYDEREGPAVVFADGTETVHLADMSGDGLSDIVRVRNGETCYWSNQGYGRFGRKVTMEQSPRFDASGQFDPRRIRFADIDGSGTTDLIYLGRREVALFFNQAGNGFSEAKKIHSVPPTEMIANVQVVDLLGQGTACLVWSSVLPADRPRPLAYVDLMGGRKPHLLERIDNNLGGETRIAYASSTKFYLQDKQAGRPWFTRLPFPVHLIERIESYDHIAKSKLSTTYRYRHGFFDGHEREFRGFAYVETLDAESFSGDKGSGLFPAELDAAPNELKLPPVLTKTWFHTGAWLDRERLENELATEFYAGDPLAPPLLRDTILPEGLSAREEREAARALRGQTLRQEIYALDELPESAHPYTVSEQSFETRLLQPAEAETHAVFFVHPRETVTLHYERRPNDPRMQHALTLQVDDFGNVLKEVAIGYGRRQPDSTLPTQDDREKQTRILITYTENHVTNAIDQVATHPNDYRAPLPSETQTYELTGFKPENGTTLFSYDEWTRNHFALPTSATEITYEQTADNATKQKRLIEHVRSLYRKDDLSTILPLGQVEPLALPGESYKLAFTPGLLAQVFQRDGVALLPNPVSVLGAQGPDRGGYVLSQDLKAIGGFPNTDPDDHWWIPSGRMFLSPGSSDTVAQELAYAQDHFFLPHRYRDPFHTNTISAESVVSYDSYDLLMLETRDALDNRITVGERGPGGAIDPTKPGNDYRVLQPWRVMDPNRNRNQVAFDILGMVVGTAVMGKPEENHGDALDGFNTELTETIAHNHLANPLDDPHAILGRATKRLVYDLFAYQRSKDQPDPQPAVVYTLTRETHDSDLGAGEQTKIQHSFSYSDGFNREIQNKIQAEPETINGMAGPPRWVGSGWTIFNNKSKPVRQYEPFFSATHRFEFGVRVGVSPILFYDPAERVVATLHPNHSYEKVVFDPWQQVNWDVNDTVLGDPRTDTDIQGYTAGYFESLPASPPAPPWQTWHAQRQGGTLGVQEQAAAGKAAAHAETPTTAYFDSIGRPFLTVAHNKVASPNHDLDGTEDKFHNRVELDIEGNERAVRDAIQASRDQQGNTVVDELGRIVMSYAYDMLGNRIHQSSMEAGARWMLNDVTGNPIRVWDNRGHTFRTEYDPLRRPMRSFITGTGSANPNQELLTDRMVYGEQHPQAELRNLRGALYLQLEQAGVVTTEASDFKGNSLSATHRIATEYKHAIDWSTVDAVLPANTTAPLAPAMLEAALTSLLDAETYTSLTSYDALNRPVMMTTPHTPTMQPNVIRPGYNEANLLERMDANLRGATANGQLSWTAFVTNIDYDAKGQRLRIDYGNGVSTVYDYDLLTFRLVHLRTKRHAAAFPDDCPQPPPAGSPGCQVQNLHYSYDPVGNITHIRDDAQQAIYFKNKRVEPSADYTYDALYRLIEATGREHLGQGGAPVPHSHNDENRVGLQSGNVPSRFGPNDGTAMGAYIERYVYDAMGNFLEMQHRGSDPTHAGWTRSYDYAEPSQLEPGKQSNRLTGTTIGNANPITETYSTSGNGYDTHGNMLRMPYLSLMRWNYRDQLQSTARQVVNNGGTQETTWYVYDAGGERVRKLTELANGQLKHERIYFGGFEIYRDYNTDGTVKLERETLHMMDDSQRIALVETRTLGTEAGGTETTYSLSV